VSDNPYQVGYLEEIVGVNFAGGLVAVWMTVGTMQSTGIGGHRSGTLEAFGITGAPFTIPDIGALSPFADWDATVDNASGHGDMSFSLGPFSRLGTPSGADVPITDQVTNAMKSAFKAWQGQFITTSRLHADVPTPLFLNVDGYLIINMSKIANDLDFHITAPAQVSSNTVAVASYKKGFKKTVLSPTDDSLTITTSTGQTDHLGQFPLAAKRPTHCDGYGFASGGGGLATNIRVKVVKRTLAVTVT